MARFFEFSSTTKKQAWERQNGKCGHCGEDMLAQFKGEDSIWFQAHHVIPDQTGRTNDPQDAFLRTVDNCVYLCDNCHRPVGHNNNTRTGAVGLPQAFLYSHGTRGSASHKQWGRLVNDQWGRIQKRK